MVIKSLFKSKKGFFFSIIAILMLFMMFLFYKYADNDNKINDNKVIQVEVESMNAYVTDIDSDVQRALYIASFRGLLGMNQRVTDTGNFISNLNVTATEVILNGSINGIKMNVTEESYLGAWLKSVTILADNVNLVVNISNSSIHVYQDNPWTVKFRYNFTLFLTDKQRIANWTVDKSVEAEVYIYEFEDPIYTVKSNKQLLNKVVKYPYNISDLRLNSTNFLNFVNKSYYIESVSAPSYLDRLQGKNSSSPYGIESMVRDYGAMTATDKLRTRTDYYYWFETDVPAYQVPGSDVRVDNETMMGGMRRLAYYNLTTS